MHTLSFQIDDKLNKQLEYFSKEHDRSKGYVLRKALKSFLEDQRDLEIGREALEELYSSSFKTYTLKQIKKENVL